MSAVRVETLKVEGNPLLINSPRRDTAFSPDGNLRRETLSPLNSPTEGEISKIKVENLSDAKLIHPNQLQPILKKLAKFENNDELLDYLEDEKSPYLFNSDALLSILMTTPSVKTRMAIIEMLGPRLTDPKAKPEKIIELFRYVEHQERTKEIFKSRQSAIISSMFLSAPNSKAHGGIRSGLGRGGMRSGTRNGTRTSILSVGSPSSISSPLPQILEEKERQSLSKMNDIQLSSSPKNNIVYDVLMNTLSSAPEEIAETETIKSSIGSRSVVSPPTTARREAQSMEVHELTTTMKPSDITARNTLTAQLASLSLTTPTSPTPSTSSSTTPNTTTSTNTPNANRSSVTATTSSSSSTVRSSFLKAPPPTPASPSHVNKNTSASTVPPLPPKSTDSSSNKEKLEPLSTNEIKKRAIPSDVSMKMIGAPLDENGAFIGVAFNDLGALGRDSLVMTRARKESISSINTTNRIIVMVPHCPGLVVKIRPQPNSDDPPTGLIKSGQLIEVYSQKVQGFYQLVNGDGYINKNTVGVNWTIYERSAASDSVSSKTRKEEEFLQYFPLSKLKSMGIKPHHEGILLKLSDWLKEWRPRYFSLYGTRLFVQPNKDIHTNEEPKVEIDFSIPNPNLSLSIVIVKDKRSSSGNAYQLQISKIKDKPKGFALRSAYKEDAQAKADLELWMATILSVANTSSSSSSSSSK